MKKGDMIDYKYPRKKHWMKQVHNDINIRVGSTKADKTVLYLAGPQANDRDLLLKKGFKDKNLFGIDLNEENIYNLRMKGGLGICADISDILLNWKEPKIDVVIADFCSGYSINVDKFKNSILLSQGLHQCSIIMVNLMRGRDKYINDFRELLNNDPSHKAENNDIFLRESRRWGIDEKKIMSIEEAQNISKDRGWIFILSYLKDVAKLNNFYDDNTGKYWKGEKGRIINDIYFPHRETVELYMLFNDLTGHRHFLYKSESGNIYFDTVIFERAFNSTFSRDNDYFPYYPENTNIKKKIAALKALRTSKYGVQKDHIRADNPFSFDNILLARLNPKKPRVYVI